jgi:hypothetical protein
MNIPTRKNLVPEIAAKAGEAESTLRLIANLPVPEGLELRVKTALRAAPKQSTASLFAWPPSPSRSWTESVWMRGAAAAAIVCVVAGGGWQVYSRVQPKPTALALPHVAGGFSSAGAVRTPHTLDGPTLAHPQANVSNKKALDAKKKMLPTIKTALTPAQQ